MLTFENGASAEMTWRRFRYTKHGDHADFMIVLMKNGIDFVLVPTKEQWNRPGCCFTEQERLEAIYLIDHVRWNRAVKAVEAGVEPTINEDNEAQLAGSIVLTEAYQKLTELNLFDPGTPMEIPQVRKMYLEIEGRFILNAEGQYIVDKSLLLDGSLLKEYILPLAQKNTNLQVEYR